MLILRRHSLWKAPKLNLHSNSWPTKYKLAVTKYNRQNTKVFSAIVKLETPNVKVVYYPSIRRVSFGTSYNKLRTLDKFDP